MKIEFELENFNPRSLTGATGRSIHDVRRAGDFNPRSLTGATDYPGLQSLRL